MTILLALVLSLVPLLLATPAQAAPRVPDTPKFGKAIEGYAAYEPNTICDPVDRPGATKLAGLIRQTYGSDESIGISRNACYTTSEHNDGRAVDWMIDVSNSTEKAKADAFLHWLLATDSYGNKNAMARRLGIMYIIFNHRIWRAYGNPGWGDYTGTNPHTDHIHFSLSFDGSSGRTSFWTGNALAAPCVNESLTQPAPKVVTDPMRYVPVDATRVASTELGVGMVNGKSCRLFASSAYTSHRLDVDVTGKGDVPSEGVAAVALQVSMRHPNWDSYLRAGPAGGEIPKVRRISTAQNKTSASLLVLPVGANGKVSFLSNVGATDLSASVVGYYVDPAAPLSVRRAIAPGGGNQFDPVAPARLYPNVAIGRAGRFKAQIAGKAGTDPSSTAAVVSVTVDPGDGSGKVFAYQAGSDRPRLPLFSYGPGQQTVQTVVPLSHDGSLVVENVGESRRTFDIDVSGAYESASLPGGRGYAARRSPKTVVDTAADLGLSFLGSGKSKTFSVADAVARGTSAVLLQVTARKPKTPTELSFWRPGTATPHAVDMSVSRGEIVTSTVVAAVSKRGHVRVRNASGIGMDVRVTVLGAFR
ncbi:MAG TPA: hypothetical protein VMT88_03410 [Actinomycetes bacterium]|nr:hypothetical protein [Actinomycetes bacterium]